MTSRIPPLLESYVRPPARDDLVLVTSVLGASASWLVLRFLYNALAPPAAAEGGEEYNVVLVSFMRDFEFWRETAKRVGLDLPRLAQRKRFSFVDGLTGLFADENGPAKISKYAPARIGAQRTLRSPQLAGAGAEAKAEIERLAEGGKRVLLVLDQPDLLLAATGEDVGAPAMADWVLDLREAVHSTIVVAAADYPLVQNNITPLETKHAAFVLGLAHQASYTISLRLLDTGMARDISGVMRVTLGPDLLTHLGDDKKTIEEKELLYFVGGDGGVNVFERGQHR